MNWMANSKNRVQKRRSTAVNIQRGYFAARNSKLPSVPIMHTDTNLSQQQERFGLHASQCEFRPISNADKKYYSSKGSEQTVQSLKKGLDSTYSQPRLVQGKGFPTIVSEFPKAFQSTSLSNSVERTDGPTSRTQKAHCGKRSNTNHFEEGEYLHPDSDLLETIDRLMKVISEQKKRIKLLEERCSRYESEPCTGLQLQGVGSGGPPSYQGSIEKSPDRKICRYQDGASDHRDQMHSIPRFNDSRVEIKICSGAFSCVNTDSHRTNNTTFVTFPY